MRDESGTVEIVVSGNRQPVSRLRNSKEAGKKVLHEICINRSEGKRTKAKLCVCCGGWDIGNGYLLKSQLSGNSCLDCAASEVNAASSAPVEWQMRGRMCVLPEMAEIHVSVKRQIFVVCLKRKKMILTEYYVDVRPLFKSLGLL